MEERALQAVGEDRSKAGMMGGASRESMVTETIGSGAGVGGGDGLDGGRLGVSVVVTVGGGASGSFPSSGIAASGLDFLIPLPFP